MDRKNNCMDTDLTPHILSIEQERCRCIVAQDFDALKNLLSSRLVHIHSRGNQDGRDSYIEYLAKTIEILELKRENLEVRLIDDTAAVMIGQQKNRARLRGQVEEVRVAAQVMQIWARESDGCWRQLAFQATPLGLPPPLVQR
jgi:Domain of unknown function (DUF4440)